MTMRMSADGRAKLIEREGLRTKAYRDSVGVWTIGVGHTSAAGAPSVTPGLVITKAQADEILSRDLRQFEALVNDAVRAPLSQGQFDALCSFAFNIGDKGGRFRKSTAVRRLNEGNYVAAADALLLWNKPPEIKRRRESERAQFLAATRMELAGRPVRFVAADDLHEEEALSVDYLRAAGSRTIANADTVKAVAKTVLGGDLGGAAVQAADAVQKARDAYAGFAHGADLLELARDYWPLVAGLLLTIVIAYVAWRALHAAERIIAARVDDARIGFRIGGASSASGESHEGEIASPA